MVRSRAPTHRNLDAQGKPVITSRQHLDAQGKPRSIAKVQSRPPPGEEEAKPKRKTLFRPLPDPGVDPAIPNLPADQLDPDDQTLDVLTGNVASWDKPECDCLLSVKCPHGYGQPVDQDGAGLLWLTASLAMTQDAGDECESEHADDSWPIVSLADVRAVLRSVRFATLNHPEAATLTVHKGIIPGHIFPEPNDPDCSWWDLRGYVEGNVWTWDGRYAPENGFDGEKFNLWIQFIVQESPQQFKGPASTLPNRSCRTHADILNLMILRHVARQLIFHIQDGHRRRRAGSAFPRILSAW